MTDIVNRRRMRHAHMVNITPRIMTEGMRADFRAVDQHQPEGDRHACAPARHDSRDDGRRARTSRRRSTPPTAGSRPAGSSRARSGATCPGGEVFTTPGNVDGTFVIDGVVGDWLCDRYGLLSKTPLTVRIKDSRLVSDAQSTNQALRDDFWAYTHTDENSDRVGEFAIGTNVELHEVIGHILQDEKFPGVHIAFGNPYGAHTGADWYSSTHIDVVGLRFDIFVDGVQIMAGGKFLI